MGTIADQIGIAGLAILLGVALAHLLQWYARDYLDDEFDDENEE